MPEEPILTIFEPAALLERSERRVYRMPKGDPRPAHARSSHSLPALRPEHPWKPCTRS